MTCPFCHQTGDRIGLIKRDILDHPSFVYLTAQSSVLVEEGTFMVGGIGWDSESHQCRSSQMPHPPPSCGTPCCDNFLRGDPDLDPTFKGAVLEGSAEPLGAVLGRSAGPRDAVLEGSAEPLATVLTGAGPVTMFRNVSVKPSNDTMELDAGITDAA